MVLHADPWYTSVRAREDRSGAVAQRAHRVHTEYVTAARELDRRFHHTQQGITGPIETFLATFPRVRSLVWGQHGEASQDVHSLLAAVAQRAAERSWRAMGCRSQAEALGVLTAHYRRRWGMLAVREYARHRVRRVPYVGAPRGTRAVGAHGRAAAEEVAPLREAYEAHQAMRVHGAWQRGA